jgi:hypothetical protein
MRVFTVPTYSEGPRTILDYATCNLSRHPFEVTDPPRRFATIYTDADPSETERQAALAARRRTAAVQTMLDRHAR